jgi:hypothetical protein
LVACAFSGGGALSDETELLKLFSRFVAEVQGLFAEKPEPRGLTLLRPSTAKLVAQKAAGTTTYRALALKLFPSKQTSSALNCAFKVNRPEFSGDPVT